MILAEITTANGCTIYISDDYAVKDRAEAEQIIAEQNGIVTRMMHRRFRETAQAREDMEYDGMVDDASV